MGLEWDGQCNQAVIVVPDRVELDEWIHESTRISAFHRERMGSCPPMSSLSAHPLLRYVLDSGVAIPSPFFIHTPREPSAATELRKACDRHVANCHQPPLAVDTRKLLENTSSSKLIDKAVVVRKYERTQSARSSLDRHFP